MKNFVLILFKGLRTEIDSVNVICSKEVGGVSEESNVTNSDKYAKEFQNVFNSISVMELDRDSRQTEIDFVNQMDVYRKRPRQWASNIPAIPTKWVHMNEGCAKQREYRSRLCMKKSNSGI